jgi:hypothetical protein
MNDALRITFIWPSAGKGIDIPLGRELKRAS